MRGLRWRSVVGRKWLWRTNRRWRIRDVLFLIRLASDSAGFVPTPALPLRQSNSYPAGPELPKLLQDIGLPFPPPIRHPDPLGCLLPPIWCI